MNIDYTLSKLQKCLRNVLTLKIEENKKFKLTLMDAIQTRIENENKVTQTLQKMLQDIEAIQKHRDHKNQIANVLLNKENKNENKNETDDDKKSEQLINSQPTTPLPPHLYARQSTGEFAHFDFGSFASDDFIDKDFVNSNDDFD
eukprot:387357_1